MPFLAAKSLSPLSRKANIRCWSAGHQVQARAIRLKHALDVQSPFQEYQCLVYSVAATSSWSSGLWTQTSPEIANI